MQARTRDRTRLLVVLAVLILLAVAAHSTGLTERFSSNSIRASVEAAGAWGVLLYICAFSMRDFVGVPAIVFVVAGVLAYGHVNGGLLAYAGTLTSISVTFWVARLIGGHSLHSLNRPRIERILAHLEARPIRTVCLLRLVLSSLSVVNLALAVTNIRFRDYLIGSAVGLIPPTACIIGGCLLIGDVLPV